MEKKKPRLLLNLWSERHLPEELWPTILSNLPVKSLLRFRTVSPSWRALIDSPDFARLHLTRFPDNRHPAHLLLDEKRPFRFTLRCTTTLSLTDMLSPSLPSIQKWRVISSIDGLFMLTGHSDHSFPRRIYQYMLWNPSIRKTQILPTLPDFPNKVEFLDFGLGFDPLAKDYKHVRLVIRRGGLQSVAVYSVGTDSWKTVELQVVGCTARWTDFHFDFSEDSFNVCLRGFLFGLAEIGGFRRPFQLVSFDLSSEVFASTKLPLEDCSDYYQYRALSLADSGSSLALIDFWKDGRGSVWVLEGLGADRESWSWSKRYTIASSIPEIHTNACFKGLLYIRKNEEMLLRWNKMLTSYNLRTHKEQIIMKKDLSSGKLAFPYFYIESLVLLK